MTVADACLITVAQYSAKLVRRQKIEDERDRLINLINKVRADARARNKPEDDPGVQLEIDNLTDHANRLIEQSYE